MKFVITKYIMGCPGAKYTHSKAKFSGLNFKWPKTEDISQISASFSFMQSGGIFFLTSFVLLFTNQSSEK